MDHVEAVRTNAVDRYAIGEMNLPEASRFEAHYFGCKDCATELAFVEMMARNLVEL